MNKKNVVVDTNVALVANRMATHVDQNSVQTCIQALQCIMKTGRVVLDDQWNIMKEYMRQLNSSGQPGEGYAFLTWLLKHRQDQKYCLWVSINADAVRGYQEFPNDPALNSFDPSDRKFVAVALSEDLKDLDTPPPILNASDTDWWNHRAALNAHGIQIKFLCPHLMP